jgi:hypothetical protein
MKEEISLQDISAQIRKIWGILVRKWLILACAGVVGGVAGYFFARMQKPVFKSNLNFVVNDNEGFVPSSVSSLAGLVGIGASGGSATDDKVVFLATSRTIIGSALLSRQDFGPGQPDKILINEFIDAYKLQSVFRSDTILKEFTYVKNTTLADLSYQENKVLDMVIGRIVGRIVKGEMLVVTAKKKSGLVSQGAGIFILEFKSFSEKFSKYFIESLYANLSKFYVEKTINKHLRNYTIIKRRADSLKVIVESRENQGADFYDSNLNPAKMTMRVRGERIRKDVEIVNLMYAEVLKNLEISKFSLESNTPILQAIDTPVFPLEYKKPSKLKTAIIFAFIFGIIASVILLIRNNKTKKE